MNPPEQPVQALAWADGTVLPAAAATVPLMDEGVLRGDGVFETLMVTHGRVHAFPEHHARLLRSAARLSLDVPDVTAPFRRVLEAFGPHDGIAKIVLLRGGTLRVIVAPAAPWPGTLQLDVQELPWGGPLAGAKTLSYALNQFAVRVAHERGYDDALIIEDGWVQELAHGTIVLVEGGTLVTPDPAQTGILASVTLDVLTTVRDVVFDRVWVDRLHRADELFVLSATRLAVGVHKLHFADGTCRVMPAPGPVTCDAHDALVRHVASHAQAPEQL